jgi:predicted acylesterase/phospholipase RssA
VIHLPMSCGHLRGVLNNLPVDLMRSRCHGTVIASDVSLTVDLTADAHELVAAAGWPLLWARLNPFATVKPKLPHIFEILTRTATLSSIHHGASVAGAADLYLRTPTEGVPTFDWQARTLLVDRAYRLAHQEIEQWQNAGEPRR